MSTVSETLDVVITRQVTIKLDPSEHIPVRGDSKPAGGFRTARVTELVIVYRWDSGRWVGSYTPTSYLRQQQKADGSWSEPRWDEYVRLGDGKGQELTDAARPTTEVTVEEIAGEPRPALRFSWATGL
jgi:hypothetical protein